MGGSGLKVFLLHHLSYLLGFCFELHGFYFILSLYKIQHLPGIEWQELKVISSESQQISLSVFLQPVIALFNSLLLGSICSLHSIKGAEKVSPTLGTADNFSEVFQNLSMAAAPLLHVMGDSVRGSPGPASASRSLWLLPAWHQLNSRAWGRKAFQILNKISSSHAIIESTLLSDSILQSKDSIL